MVGKNCGGAVPTPGEFSAEDVALLNGALQALEKAREAMETQAIHRALEAVWQSVGEANRYVDSQAPWALRKTDPDRMATVLFTLAETIRRIATMTQPVMPTASSRILDQLSVPDDARDFASLLPEPALRPGTALPKPQGVFPRLTEREED
jgi:methionyl-tRNA synthetase